MSEVTASALINEERQRQKARWSKRHDAEHGPHPILAAAMCYESGNVSGWPWDSLAWRPRDPMRDLVKAGALFQAAADCCPRRLSTTPLLRQAVDGRARCEERIDKMLTATQEPTP